MAMNEDALPSLNTTLPGEAGAAKAGGVKQRPIAPGASVGRYIVIDKLGAGAMGVVYAAYDPELDRKVALKLLVPREGESVDARARLQREAQALAKLDHPNVVTVHDVGVHAGQLFVSMEFVAGETLGAWMADARSWRAVSSTFIEAGRGLAAVHAAGLVHRDFKPDNVMLGEDGRVRVMDFGLARGEAEDAGGTLRRERAKVPVAELSARELGASTLLASRLTQTGAILGTPAYMAPEQFEGQQGDARSDQFAFCVALYEALYAERPFPGATVGELYTAIDEQRLRPASRRAKVPSWLRAVVVRGLARDADARWPSMSALLDALRKDPRVRRRKLGAAGLIVGLLAGGAWGVWSLAARDAQVCAHPERHLVGVWDEGRRAELGSAFAAVELDYAADTWARTEARLDDYAANWASARREACEDSVRGEQSSELLDLRMACLDHRLDQLGATVEVLAGVDEAVLSKAIDAVVSLPGLERCADAKALLAERPPPEDPAAAREVEVIDAKLARVEARANAGLYTEGLELVSELALRAEAIGYEPLLVRVRVQQGGLQSALGEYETAELTLRQAYGLALGLGMAEEAATASRALVEVVGAHLGRHADARGWAEHAEPLARLVGSDEARALYLNSLAYLAMEEGAYDEAQRSLEQSLELWERSTPDHSSVATALANLGVVAHEQGDGERARDYIERALVLRERVHGPGHPDVAYTLANLGVLSREAGDYRQARIDHERALELFERAFGPEHMTVATSFNNLGQLAKLEGDYEQARRDLERAAAGFEAALGPKHPSVGRVLNNLGGLAKDEQNYVLARDYLERGLAIKEASLEPNHPSIAFSLINLGQVARAQERSDEARTYFERALRVREQAYGAEDPRLVEVLRWLGRVLEEQEEHGLACEHLERALALEAEQEDATPEDLAGLRFALARSLWRAPAGEGRDRARARVLAGEARETYAELGEAKAEKLAKLDAWLAASK